MWTVIAHMSITQGEYQHLDCHSSYVKSLRMSTYIWTVKAHMSSPSGWVPISECDCYVIFLHFIDCTKNQYSQHMHDFSSLPGVCFIQKLTFFVSLLHQVGGAGYTWMCIIHRRIRYLHKISNIAWYKIITTMKQTHDMVLAYENYFWI